MKSFTELAQRRRSHRKYTEEPVSQENIKTILKAGLMSPTAKGLRKWHFLVTENKDKILALSKIRPAGSQFVAGAPVVIAVFGQPAVQEKWIEDTSIAAVSMQYQAEDLGLGSCWCHVNGRMSPDGNASAEDLAKEILGIPDEYSVLCLIAVGHACDERQPQDEEALKWDQVHFETFQK